MLKNTFIIDDDLEENRSIRCIDTVRMSLSLHLHWPVGRESSHWRRTWSHPTDGTTCNRLRDNPLDFCNDRHGEKPTVSKREANEPNEFLGVFQSEFCLILSFSSVIVHVREDVLVVEKFWIDLVRCQISMADNEDFSRFVTRRLRER